MGDENLVTHPGQVTLWGPSWAGLTVAVLVVIASGVPPQGCAGLTPGGTPAG